MVVTEPGRVQRQSRRAAEHLRGDDRSAAATAPRAGATAVAPTVLYALGCADQPGALAGVRSSSCSIRRFSTRIRVRYVVDRTVDRDSAASSRGQPLDQEMIDRLRSLGT